MSDQIIVQLLQRGIEQNELILKDQADAKAERAADRKELYDHMQNEEGMIKGLMAAFPKKADGSPDFEGHNLYHTTLIEESRSRAAFYRDLQHDLIKKGLFGLFAVLGALLAYWWSGQVKGQ